jgi:hypothetical protein
MTMSLDGFASLTMVMIFGLTVSTVALWYCVKKLSKEVR